MCEGGPTLSSFEDGVDGPSAQIPEVLWDELLITNPMPLVGMVITEGRPIVGSTSGLVLMSIQGGVDYPLWVISPVGQISVSGWNDSVVVSLILIQDKEVVWDGVEGANHDLSVSLSVVRGGIDEWMW